MVLLSRPLVVEILPFVTDWPTQPVHFHPGTRKRQLHETINLIISGRVKFFESLGILEMQAVAI